MKKLVLSGITGLLISCTGSQEKQQPVSQDTVKADEGTVIPSKDTASDSVAVTGTISYMVSYCGGAAPSEEMLHEKRVEKKFRHGQLYFRQGRTRIKVITDASGHYSCTLVPGRYNVYLAQNRTSDGTYWYDEKVSGKWWATQVFASFNCTGNKVQDIVLEFTCAPADRKRP